MNRGQVLYRVAELMEGRRDQFVAEVGRGRGAAARRGARDAVDRVDRPLGLVRGLGRQARPGPRQLEPGRRAVLQLHDPRADRCRRDRRTGALVAARARQPARAGARQRQRRRSCSPRRRRPLPAVTLTEVLATSDVPGGVVNLLTGLQVGARPGPRGARRRRRHRHVGRRRRRPGRGRVGGRRQRQAARPSAARRRRRAVRLGRRPGRAAPGVDRRLPRDEDGLAPDRRLTPPRQPVIAPTVVERRTYIKADPRVVWATLHDPAAQDVLYPELRLGPAAPSWPAAGATRSARLRLGLLRTSVRIESLEARPESRFRTIARRRRHPPRAGLDARAGRRRRDPGRRPAPTS